jgi:hypothetical protein
VIRPKNSADESGLDETLPAEGDAEGGVRPSSLCAPVHEASATRTSAATHEVLMRKRRHEQVERSPTGSIMDPPQSSADRASAVARGLPLVSTVQLMAPSSPLTPRTHHPHSDQVEARKASAGADPENITRSRNTRLTWAPRELLICSPFLADTIRVPRVPCGLDGHVSALGSPAGVAVAAEAESSLPAGCGDALVPRDRQGGRKGFEAESRRSAGRRTAKQLTELFDEGQPPL